jgi:uncharacterized protein (DUF58 family)
MLVPSNRLLLYTGLLGIPALTLLGMLALPMPAVAVVAFVMGLILALDAPGALGAIRGVKVTLPELLRTTKGRELELDAVVTNPGLACPSLRIGLSIPRDLACEKPVLALTLNRESERNLARWNLRAMERGNHHITQCHLEGTSRFGFWHGRRTVKCNTEIRVYPDLSRERNVLAPLFFRRGAIGVHHVRQIGKGREFEQLRAYAPGDSYDDIYWRGTAKRRFPITKMFQLERTQEIYVAVDASRRSARRLDYPGAEDQGEVAGFVAKTQLERFIQAALVLALAAEQQSDKFGLIIFSDHVQRIIPAGGGRGHYDIIRDVL